MTVVISRCPSSPEAVYEALMVATLRRGGSILMGEWGSSLVVAHGPPYPSLRYGSRRVATLRVQEAGNVCRVEGILEQRYGDYYGAIGSALALSAPFLAALAPPLGATTGILSALLTAYSLFSSRIDVNWLSSLIEEACEYSPEFEENARTGTACRLECGVRRGRVECILEPVDSDEYLLLAFSLIGFRATEGEVTNGAIRVSYSCEGRKCRLFYEPAFLAPPTTPESAALITTLLARVLC